jgi:hypothetical protein
MGGSNEDSIARENRVSQADLSREQMAQQQKALDQTQKFQQEQTLQGQQYQTDTAKTAYDRAMEQLNASLDRNKQLSGEGEAGFLNSVSAPPPELTQLKSDIANQSTEAQNAQRGQVNLNLAQQGVRGGQAATLANRSSGELNKQLGYNVNQLAYDDATKRASEKAGYYAGKAQTGNTGYAR